jgi:hypothetical protein
MKIIVGPTVTNENTIRTSVFIVWIAYQWEHGYEQSCSGHAASPDIYPSKAFPFKYKCRNDIISYSVLPNGCIENCPSMRASIQTFVEHQLLLRSRQTQTDGQMSIIISHHRPIAVSHQHQVTYESSIGNLASPLLFPQATAATPREKKLQIPSAAARINTQVKTSVAWNPNRGNTTTAGLCVLVHQPLAEIDQWGSEGKILFHVCAAMISLPFLVP